VDAVVSQSTDMRDYGMTWMGNFTLGTPAQTFGLEFDLYAPNLYVIDVNAQYYNSWADSSSAYTDVTDKQTYDSSASTSYTASDGSFSISYTYPNGSVAMDTLTVGGSLQVNVSVEVANQVQYYVQYYSNDGTFGLSTTADANASSTLLAQLQPSLDSPVVTFNLQRSSVDAYTGSGQIIFGGLADDACQTDWTMVMNTSDSGWGDYGMPYFDSVSISTTDPTANGCNVHSDLPFTIFMNTGFGNMYTSYQVQEVFVQACNASWNSSSWQYELTTDQVANAQPVYLNLANGASIRMDPDDYVAYYNGGSYLNVYGHYDARRYGWNYMSMNMNFINNHCLSKNFGSSSGAVWSIANTVTDTEATDPPSTTPAPSSSSGSGSSDGF